MLTSFPESCSRLMVSDLEGKGKARLYCLSNYLGIFLILDPSAFTSFVAPRTETLNL